jgi:putative transposase
MSVDRSIGEISALFQMFFCIHRLLLAVEMMLSPNQKMTFRLPTTNRRRPAGQQAFRTRGGKRAGAGRKPLGERAGVPHTTRPAHQKRHPVHVTLRAQRGLPSWRRQLLFFSVRRALAAASRTWFRVLHFSVQSNHVHLMVEARDKTHLTRGMRGLAIRVALAVNGVLRRRGRVWGDRYHARALRTPREVRHGIVYVLANWKKHVSDARGFDRCSSAWWFEGWKVPPSSGPPGWEADEPPVWAPREWLSSVGWRRHGLIGANERPRDRL